MNQRNIRSFEFLPLSVRLETLGGVATPLVLRGTPLPATRSEHFSTAADNQDTVEVSLFLGERPLVRDNIEIGKFKLEGIPPQKRGAAQVVVEFLVDSSCRVTAEAKLQGSQLTAKNKFEIPVDLSDQMIAKLLSEAGANRASDEAELLKIEATNRAKGLIAQAEQQLQAGPNAKLSEAVAAVGLALASGDSDDIRVKSDAFAAFTANAQIGDFADIFRDVFTQPTRRVPKQATPIKRPLIPEQKLTSAPPSQQLGKVFGGGNFTLDPQLCFVLMPFDDAFQPLYDDHVRPSVERAGLRCERADEIRGAGSITWDIWERINRARFLLADLTGQNPNVFYELGLAHATSKDVVLITQSMKFVPFDLRIIRCITYEFTPRGTPKLEASLAATFSALMKLS